MPDRNLIYLSLIIPVYNEQKIIKDTLQKVLNFLQPKKYKWEILVVDDGSRDNTLRIATKFSKKGVSTIRLKKNSGKGAALREGVKKASGKYIIYTDCDLSVPIKNIDKFLKKLDEGWDFVIGSRRVSGANIKVHQPLIRESMGRVFTFLTKKVLQTNLADFTCGLKGFDGKKGQELFEKGMVDRWAYDSEILFLANKKKYRIFQMPVEWANRADSRVNLKKVVLESLRDLLRIRLNYALGRYK